MGICLVFYSDITLFLAVSIILKCREILQLRSFDATCSIRSDTYCGLILMLSVFSLARCCLQQYLSANWSEERSERQSRQKSIKKKIAFGFYSSVTHTLLVTCKEQLMLQFCGMIRVEQQFCVARVETHYSFKKGNLVSEAP